MHFGGHKPNDVHLLCVYVWNTDKLVAGSLKAGSASSQLEGREQTRAPCSVPCPEQAPWDVACAAVGLELPAQEGGAACSHPRAALGPAHIPSQNDGLAIPAPSCALDRTKRALAPGQRWQRGCSTLSDAFKPLQPAGSRNILSFPKLQVTPPFSACDISRGALAAMQGSGSQLCQKEMMVFGAEVLAQTHLEQYCSSCF